jgi:hypothetical protein
MKVEQNPWRIEGKSLGSFRSKRGSEGKKRDE